METSQIRADIECIVGKRAILEGDTVSDLLKRLDEASELEYIHQQLRHYLTKRSYIKALAWLDNPETPHQL